MTCYDDVVRIGKKLEKMIANKDAGDAVGLDLLIALKKLPMTLDVLQKTRIGMLVNNYRKLSKNDEVVTLSKSLIKNWKKLLQDDGETNASSRKPVGSSSSASLSHSNSYNADDADSRDSMQCVERSDSSRGEESPGVAQSLSSASMEGGTRVGGVTACKVAYTTDAVRLKCREMLAAALRFGEPIEGASDIETIAAGVEDCIYEEFKNTEMKYKNRIRSRITNLKDPKNPRLRESLLLCHISVERMAVMTPEEMASDAMKTLRARLTKEAIDDHQMSTQSGTKSDLFKCGRCGKRDTQYNQVQTRSADEPMTTFVLCNHCGNRWKFC